MKRIKTSSKLPKRDWLLSDDDFKRACCKDECTIDWMLNLMWNNGITSPEDSENKFELNRFKYGYPDCPYCGTIDSHYFLHSNQWKCKKCYGKFSITCGTYIDNTKLKFYHWWRFCYLIGSLKITNSSVIAKDLCITQLSAWRMIDTLRTARKENTKTKFVNGQEILVFNDCYEVLDLLVKRINKIKLNPAIHESSITLMKNLKKNAIRKNYATI